MKRELGSLAVVMAVALFLGAGLAQWAVAGSPADVKGMQRTITGNVTSEHTLAADNGQSYWISGPKGPEVLDHIGKRVELTGTVLEGQMMGRNTYTILVESYETLGEGTMMKEGSGMGRESESSGAPATLPGSGRTVHDPLK